MFDLFIGAMCGMVCGVLVGIAAPIALAGLAIWYTGNSSAGGFGPILLVATVPIGAIVGAVIGILVAAGAFKRSDG